MLSRRQFMTTFALSTVGASKVLSNIKPASTASYSWVDGIEPKTIAIVGDIQRTSLAEQLLLSRSQNDAQREAILKAIAADKPDMMLTLGDQVAEGDDMDEWAYFDKAMKPVSDAGICVRAMLGNHDYGKDRRRCMQSFCDRFQSQADQIHGVTRLGSLALVTVDSNFGEMSQSQIYAQAESYKKTLGTLEEDKTCRGIIVASHHPPYTNSEFGGNNEIIEMFARPFMQATKTRLYLSGHVHSYERFAGGDKMFVVTGGGGGPRRLVSTSSDRPFHNDSYRKGTLRPFHYLRLKVGETALKVETMMLGSKGFSVGDSFSLGIYG